MSTKSTARLAEIAPEYLRTPQIRKLLGLSAPTFRRLVYTHADFPVPVRLSAKLSLWPVKEMREWVSKQGVKSAAAPKDKAGMPVAPLPSLRHAVDAQRKKQRKDERAPMPPRRAKKPIAHRSTVSR